MEATWITREPESDMHALREKASINSSLRDESELPKNKRDKKQIKLWIDRVTFLKTWLKKARHGEPFPCTNCVVARVLYTQLKSGNLTDQYLRWIWKTSHGDHRDFMIGARDTTGMRIGEDKWNRLLVAAEAFNKAFAEYEALDELEKGGDEHGY